MTHCSAQGKCDIDDKMLHSCSVLKFMLWVSSVSYSWNRCRSSVSSGRGSHPSLLWSESQPDGSQLGLFTQTAWGCPHRSGFPSPALSLRNYSLTTCCKNIIGIRAPKKKSLSFYSGLGLEVSPCGKVWLYTIMWSGQQISSNFPYLHPAPCFTNWRSHDLTPECVIMFSVVSVPYPILCHGERSLGQWGNPGLTTDHVRRVCESVCKAKSEKFFLNNYAVLVQLMLKTHFKRLWFWLHFSQDSQICTYILYVVHPHTILWGLRLRH